MLKKLLLVLMCGILLMPHEALCARPFGLRTIQLPAQKIAPGQGQIVIDFTVPANHKFAPEAPSTVWVRTKHPKILTTGQTKAEPLNLEALPLSIPYAAYSGATVVVIDARVHFCDENSKICLSDFVRIKFPVQVEAHAPAILKLRIPIKSKTAA